MSEDRRAKPKRAGERIILLLAKSLRGTPSRACHRGDIRMIPIAASSPPPTAPNLQEEAIANRAVDENAGHPAIVVRPRHGSRSSR